jgi:hypothetical protein
MMKRFLLCIAICTFSVAWLLLHPFSHGQIAYAASFPCADSGQDGGQQFSAPTISNGPYSNGHGSYYVEASGYDCIGSIPYNCGQYGCEDFQVYTDGFLSNGGGVFQVNDAGQGQESCNGSAYGTRATAGGWNNGSQATTSIFYFTVADCQTDHEYRLVSQHGAQMYSGQVAIETLCVYPTSGDGSC